MFWVKCLLWADICAVAKIAFAKVGEVIKASSFLFKFPVQRLCVTLVSKQHLSISAFSILCYKACNQGRMRLSVLLAKYYFGSC